MIYLDNAATTQIDPAVLEKMMPFLQENYGNAGTLYKLGRRSRSAIENARAQVAKLIDAEPEQIVFTSGGTEGNNMVINFAGRYMQANGKKIMAVSAIEHDSVLKPARYLATNGVIGLETLPVDSTGHVILGNVKKLDSQNTGFISIMRANNELGIANNVQLAGKYAHEHGALFHVDCVQALGSERLSMKEIDCDFATFSSHKIHGPKGVGAVYIKDPERFIPLIFGGENQEHGLRGGTENVAGIVGFGEACRLICEIDVNELQQRYDTPQKSEPTPTASELCRIRNCLGIWRRSSLILPLRCMTEVIQYRTKLSVKWPWSCSDNSSNRTRRNVCESTCSL